MCISVAFFEEKCRTILALILGIYSQLMPVQFGAFAKCMLSLFEDRFASNFGHLNLGIFDTVVLPTVDVWRRFFGAILDRNLKADSAFSWRIFDRFFLLFSDSYWLIYISTVVGSVKLGRPSNFLGFMSSILRGLHSVAEVFFLVCH